MVNGLTSALSNALAGLLTTSGQGAVVSRNITRANDENYARESAPLTTSFGGAVTLAGVQRAAQKQLTDTLLQATSNSVGQTALLDAYTTLSSTVGDVQADGSIAWGMDQLQQALQGAEADPANRTLADQAVASAGSLAKILNDASATVQDVRAKSDQAIAASVQTMNALLDQFGLVDKALASPSASGDEKAAAADTRDALLKQMAAEIGIRTNQRADGTTAIYTDGGVTLFDRTPRTLTFNASTVLTPETSGAAVFADGVPIAGAASPMPSKSGRIASLAQVRDAIAPVYQRQLDEMARGLITAFSEKDQGASATGPAATGLFSYDGSPALPNGGAISPGLAAQIRLNNAFQSSAGGNPFILRDGGANGPAYVYNTSSASAFQGRLSSLIGSMSQTQSFSVGAGLAASNTLAGFATDSAGWVEQGRAAANVNATTADSTLSRAKDALSRDTGVNLDEEMANLLSIEKSYQASAKLLTTVDQMMGDLMNAVH